MESSIENKFTKYLLLRINTLDKHGDAADMEDKHSMALEVVLSLEA